MYSTVTSGLEKLSKLEFDEKFQSEIDKIEIFQGKILFSLKNQVSNADILKKLSSCLRSVEHLFLIIFSFVLTEKKSEILKAVTPSEKSSTLTSILFEEIQENFNKIENFMGILEVYKTLKNINSEKVVFRIDIKENVLPRSDKNELAKLIADFLEKKYAYLEADTAKYDLKLNLEKIEKVYYFSIKLTMNQPLGISQVSILREKTRATMRPSIAYNLCRLLNIEEGDIVLDPMCGSSMLLEIAMKEFKNQGFYICADIDEFSIKKSQKNLEGYGFVDLVLCNSARSPFRKNCINKIITDMPFGKRCGSHHTNMKIYPDLIKDFNRIIHKEGKAVVVTTEKSLIFNNFKKKTGWNREDVFMINKGGLDTFVVVSKKSDFRKKKKKKEVEEVKVEEDSNK